VALPTRRQSNPDRRADIEWSHDPLTIESVLRFCEQEVSEIRRKQRNNPTSRDSRYYEMRIAILERIHGNLGNAARRAFPSSISITTVERQLAKSFDDSPAGQAAKAGSMVALVSEWYQLRTYFERNFTKPNPDPDN
jgi:hypothetical protein